MKRRLVLALEKVYTRIPAIACKGLCTAMCGAIEMSALELRRMTEAGAPPACAPSGTCVLLKGGRCSAYALRPLICRLFGVAESLTCEHGCEVDGEILSDAEVLSLFVEMMSFAGDKAGHPTVAARATLR